MYQHPGAQNNTISQLSAIHPMGAPWQPPEGQLPFPKICDLLDVYNTNETDLTNMLRASIRMYASRNDSPLHLPLLGDGHGGNPRRMPPYITPTPGLPVFLLSHVLVHTDAHLAAVSSHSCETDRYRDTFWSSII